MKYTSITDAIHVNYHGFHPSEFTRSYLSTLLEELYDEAPYGATVDATFTRNGEIFKGVLTIHSAAGKFFATASDTKLKEASRKLAHQIRHRLDKWKFRGRHGSHDVAS